MPVIRSRQLKRGLVKNLPLGISVQCGSITVCHHPKRHVSRKSIMTRSHLQCLWTIAALSATSSWLPLVTSGGFSALPLSVCLRSARIWVTVCLEKEGVLRVLIYPSNLSSLFMSQPPCG